MTGQAAPAGVPSLLKVGEVARILNVGEQRVKVWLEHSLPHDLRSKHFASHCNPAASI